MAVPEMGYQMRAFGRVLRRVGQSVDSFGASVMGKEGYTERLVPSTRVVPIKGAQFKYGLQNFVASSASVVGAVTVGEMTSVWYGATVRGDAGSVTMGRNVSVLDNATVRCSKGAPTRIGDEAVISPGATVTSAEIGDGAMIGMGAVVSAGAKVGNDAFVDAGAVVAPGTVIPPGQLWTGAPARFLRALSPEEMKYVRSLALEYAGLSQRHFDQGQKDVPTLEEEAGWADYKVVKGMEPSDAMPTADPDVVRYYELTAAPADSGVFRAEERNLEAEAALREAEEIAADAEENALYQQAAHMRRVAEGAKSLAALKPSAVDARVRLLADLAALDARAAQAVAALASDAAAAAASGDAGAKVALVGRLAAHDPATFYADDRERVAAAEAVFAGLAAHGKAAGSLPLPAAAAGAGGAGAGARA